MYVLSDKHNLVDLSASGTRNVPWPCDAVGIWNEFK